MSRQKDQIAELRIKIDSINQEILDLVNKRTRLALEIIKIKKTSEIQVYDADRTASMLADVLDKNQGPLSDQDVRRLFKEIFKAPLSK